MTNREYFEKNNKSVSDMMAAFNKSKCYSFDTWMNKSHSAYSNEVKYVSEDGCEVTGDNINPKKKYIAIHIVNEKMMLNDCDFYVRIKDLTRTDHKECKWSKDERFVESVPLMEDGEMSGQKITSALRLAEKISDFPAFDKAWSMTIDVGDRELRGFLGTVFQFRALWKHADEIKEILEQLGENCRMRDIGWMWTSTQRNATLAWHWHSSGFWDSNFKGTNFYVLPFFAIH